MPACQHAWPPAATVHGCGRLAGGRESRAAKAPAGCTSACASARLSAPPRAVTPRRAARARTGLRERLAAAAGEQARARSEAAAAAAALADARAGRDALRARAANLADALADAQQRAAAAEAARLAATATPSVSCACATCTRSRWDLRACSALRGTAAALGRPAVALGGSRELLGACARVGCMPGATGRTGGSVRGARAWARSADMHAHAGWRGVCISARSGASDGVRMH